MKDFKYQYQIKDLVVNYKMRTNTEYIDSIDNIDNKNLTKQKIIETRRNNHGENKVTNIIIPHYNNRKIGSN